MSLEQDFPAGFVYARCDCNVWELAVGYRFGRCKRCGVRPHTPATRDEWENRSPFGAVVVST